MRKGIIPHSKAMNDNELQLLDGFDFIFMCMDDGSVKKSIIEFCEQKKISFY